jgi:two-component system chemotaxis response regulator CheB
MLCEMLESDPGFEVVAEAANGAEAVEATLRTRPDLITMDVHMPVLDGIDATKEIMRLAPTPILIVTAASRRGDIETSLSATQAGALMLIQKPESPTGAEFEEQRQRLLSMARAMAAVKVVRRWTRPEGTDLAWRRSKRSRPSSVRLVAIGSSAGGPAALRRLLIDLPPDFPVPIVVVQHMSPGFIDGLASWLAANCALRVNVAADGMQLLPSAVYLAPDNRHLGVTEHGRATLSTAEPVEGFRPSASFLFDSVGRSFSGAAVAAILTGMGRDGVSGLRTVRTRGGTVLAQDEASSVVFGMAQEAIREGLVDEVLPIELIGRRLRDLTT